MKPRRRWTALSPLELLAILLVLIGFLASCTSDTSPVDDAAAGATTEEPSSPTYLDASAPVEDRVADLLTRMTLEDKVGQMTLVEKNAITPEEAAEARVGAVLSGGGGAPRPNTPAAWRELVGGYQEALAGTDLGIPVLYGVDAVHGHNNLRDATIFPHNVGLGATRDADLVERISRATATETAATGIRWNYAPVLAVPQDIRWGRTYEAYGQDPDLVGELAAAYVRGLQRDDLTATDSVLATPKHWVGDGGTVWGTSTAEGYQIDQGVTEADEQTLRDVHVAPYPAAFDAGAITVMASYSSWENGKVHGDEFLLTDLLRDELDFGGMVVSDWGAVDQIDPGDYYGSVVQAINAGIDLVMVPTEYELFQTVVRGGVEQGDISQARLDEAVGRILEVKFRMGLFEEPLPGEELLDTIGSDDHRALAREAVARSAVLLRTDGEVLPLGVGTDERLLVAGPAAADIGIQSGGWTISWQGDNGDITAGSTILDGLEAAVDSEVVYNRTGRFDDVTGTVGIAVVGERPYAEGRGDDADLRLSDNDVAVVARLAELVDHLVVVIVSGRPLVLADDLAPADAVVAAWLPGSEGAGVADVLTGAAPFSGRLPFAWPASSDVLGQVPTDACDGVLFPYGHGLATSGDALSDAPTCDRQES